MHDVVWNRDKSKMFALYDKDNQPIDDTVFLWYEEVQCTTNQELEFILSPFDGDFKNGQEYFLTVYKEKVNSSEPLNHFHDNSTSRWTSILRTEKLCFNDSLAPWKAVKIPLNCLVNTKDPNYDFNTTHIKIGVS